MVIVGANVVINSSTLLFSNNSTLSVVNGSVTIAAQTVLVVRVSRIPSSSGDEVT